MASIKSSCARVAYADWVRVLAALMVVMIHTAAPIFNTMPPDKADFALVCLLDSVTHAAVPLFVMVSGMFMLDEQRRMSVRRVVTKYALPLVGLFFFWSILYALANKLVMPLLFEDAVFSGALVREFAVAVLEGAYHMWYLPMMAGLYLLCPLLRRVVSRDNRRPVEYFLLLVLVLGFALPTGARLCDALFYTAFSETADSFWLLQGLQYPAYFVAGWYIANFRPQTHRVAVYGTGAAALLAMVGLTWWLSVRSGEAYAALMEPLSFFCCVYAVALFALFAWEGKGLHAHGWLTRFSALTFGVYIIHVEVQSLYRVFLPYEGGAPLVYCLIQWLAVTAVSLAATFVLSRIPIVRRLVRG